MPDVVDDDVYPSVTNTGNAAWSASVHIAAAQNPTVGKCSRACFLSIPLFIVGVGRRAAEILLLVSAIIIGGCLRCT